MATTPHLGLTLLEQAQAQKEITINEALARIDAVLNSGVIDRGLSAPPTSPTAGDVYIVAASPTGAWAGKAGQVAYFDQVWRFIVPREGMLLFVNDEDVHVVYNGTGWQDVLTGLGGSGGSGDMDSATYDPANIAQQLVGTTATQTLTNKTLTNPNITGTTTNDNAAAGSVGQYVSASLSHTTPVSLSNSTQTNVTSMSLTAGDWDVWGTVGFITHASTVVAATIGSISTTSAALGAPNSGAYFNVAGNVQNTVAPTGIVRLSLASTTTVYLVAYSVFTTNTQSAYGFLGARRVR